MTMAYADVTVKYNGRVEFEVPDDVFDVDGYVWDKVVDSLDFVPDDVEYLNFDDYSFEYDIEEIG